MDHRESQESRIYQQKIEQPAPVKPNHQRFSSVNFETDGSSNLSTKLPSSQRRSTFLEVGLTSLNKIKPYQLHLSTDKSYLPRNVSPTGFESLQFTHSPFNNQPDYPQTSRAKKTPGSELLKLKKEMSSPAQILTFKEEGDPVKVVSPKQNLISYPNTSRGSLSPSYLQSIDFNNENNYNKQLSPKPSTINFHGHFVQDHFLPPLYFKKSVSQNFPMQFHDSPEIKEEEMDDSPLSLSKRKKLVSDEKPSIKLQGVQDSRIELPDFVNPGKPDPRKKKIIHFINFDSTTPSTPNINSPMANSPHSLSNYGTNSPSSVKSAGSRVFNFGVDSPLAPFKGANSDLLLKQILKKETKDAKDSRDSSFNSSNYNSDKESDGVNISSNSNRTRGLSDVRSNDFFPNSFRIKTGVPYLKE
jgi:hypothetical protein